MDTKMAGGAAEWRRYFMVPIAGAVGYATSVIHIYGLGPYIPHVAETFGWSRAQVSVGLTIATLIQALCSIPIGLLVDRYGPRVFGVIGVVLTCAAFALIGTASGDDKQWYLLWVLMAAATLPAQATVWTAAVASRFEASRGLAFAVTLCGASVAIAVFPVLGTWLIEHVGWRTAFAAQGAIWLAIALPIIFLFFRGARDKQRGGEPAPNAAPRDVPGVRLAEGLFSTVYARLFLACLLFTFTIVSLAVNFVPILREAGSEPMAAAGTASLVGIFSIIGRLGTGVLLDRLPGSLVGAVVFLLPAPACLALGFAGEHLAAQMFAAAMVGLTLGAEIDVMTYLCTRHFGLKSFGGLYGGLLIALSLGTAIGPLAASRVFDLYGSYTPFLWITIGCMIASSIAMFSLPHPRPIEQLSPA